MSGKGEQTQRVSGSASSGDNHNESDHAPDPGIDANEPVIGSGVAHSVVTNEWTKNAINPRNVFLDNPTSPEPSTSQASHPAPQAASRPPIHSSPADTAAPMAQDPPHHMASVDALTAHDPLTTAKTPISHNMQRLDIEAVADQQKFFESLTKLEEKLHQLKAKQTQMNRQAAEGPLHLQDNWQSLGKGPALGDNRQSAGEASITDTHASLDAGRHIEQRSVYLDKKNIRDNVQYVREQPLDAPAAASAKALQPEPTNDTSDSAQETPQPQPQPQPHWRDDIFEDLDSEAGMVREVLVGDLGAFNEDELRARVRAMKERLRQANQSLRNTEAENEKINPNGQWLDNT